MKKLKHTPGKYRLVRDLDGYLIDPVESDVYIAKVYMQDLPNAEFEANARLFAAAPELLEACHAILAVLASSQIQLDCIDPLCKCEGNEAAKDAVALLQAVIEKVKGA